MRLAGGAGMRFEFPVMVGDIGGTNGRFMIVDAPGAPPSDTVTVKTGAYSSIEAAIAANVARTTLTKLKTLVLAIASPVIGDRFPLTNAEWIIDPPSILDRLGLGQLLVMNDFAAQGLAAVALKADALKQLGGGGGKEKAPKVIIGPGTGLGVAIAVHGNAGWRIISGEGGHVDLGPRTERERALWPFLRKREARMEAELAISGQGLENLYQAIRRLDEGRAPDPLPAATISERAAKRDPAALEALELMITLLGRLAGDLALTVMARGGVFLTGGITRHVLPFLEKPLLRQAFEDKQPFAHILREIPIRAMIHPNPALAGLAELVAGTNDFDLGQAARHFGVEGSHW